MSTYTRPSKTVSGDGGTAMVAGKTLPAAELNSEFDGLTNAVNALNEDNIDAGAQIPNSVLVDIDCAKVTDNAEDEAAFNNTTDPGDTGTPTLPTDLEEELEVLRYRVGALKGYRSNVTYTTDGDANADAAWYEPLIRGRNLLANGGFEGALADATSAPDGWTEVGTLTGCAIESAGSYDSAGTDKRSFKFDASSTDEGVSQTITGLKASTKYLFGVQYEITTGSINVLTTGGLAATNNYQDPTVTDSTLSTLSTIQGIVQTDSSGTDIVLGITSGTATSDINLIEAWFYELGDDIPSNEYSIPTQTATSNTQDTTYFGTLTGGQWNDQALSDLDLSQYIPAPGFRIVYEAQISWETSISSSGGPYLWRLLLDTGGGDSTVDGPYVHQVDNIGGNDGITQGHTTHLRYVLDNATPGTTYAFTVEGSAYGAIPDITINPLYQSEQSISRAWLRVERM